jgi:hypothetical protein
MVTKEAFITRLAAYQRLHTRMTVGLVAAIAAVEVLLNVPSTREVFSESTRGLVSSVWVLVAIAGYWLVSIRVLKARCPLCPHCTKTLNGAAGQVAVASGNCGHCGSPVFEVSHV